MKFKLRPTKQRFPRKAIAQHDGVIIKVQTHIRYKGRVKTKVYEYLFITSKVSNNNYHSMFGWREHRSHYYSNQDAEVMMT